VGCLGAGWTLLEGSIEELSDRARVGGPG